jgi:hypothetical protein
MFKSILAAAAVAIPMALASSSTAKADVDVYLGFPHFDYNVGPGYRFRDGYGWYNPRRERLSCRQGARLLEREGFDVIRPVDCEGRTYAYRVENRRGRLVTIVLNSRTGEYYRDR